MRKLILIIFLFAIGYLFTSKVSADPINEQVAVSGITDPTISMSITDTAVGFGSLDNTNVHFATANEAGSFSEPPDGQPTQISASTNAGNGLMVAIRDEGNGNSAGLWSAGVSELIAAAPSSEVVDNSKKYGAYAKNANGLTISEGFDNDGVNDVAISRTAQDFATASGPINNATVDLSLKTARDGATKAGSYADTLTITCTGNY